jgi:hypothetical protein
MDCGEATYIDDGDGHDQPLLLCKARRENSMVSTSMPKAWTAARKELPVSILMPWLIDPIAVLLPVVLPERNQVLLSS